MRERIYIRKTQGGDTKELYDSFGVVATKFPLRYFGKPKELPSNNWHDEDGEDVFMPERQRIEAYEFEAEFLTEDTTQDGLIGKIKAFMNFLCDAGYMDVYSTRLKLGRTNVRFIDYSEDATIIDQGGANIATFKVTFKVDEPRIDLPFWNA